VIGWEELVGKDNRRTKKPWNTHTHTHTHTMVKKMDEQRNRKNVNNEGRKNHRRLMNKSKRAKDKAQKKYLHRI
jgi:hypothetical protein